MSDEKRPVRKAAGAKDESVKDEAVKDETSQNSDERGELSPAQFDDDGWGETPVQMRS